MISADELSTLPENRRESRVIPSVESCEESAVAAMDGDCADERGTN